jgi:Holliday junction DNA helicase RuvA
MIAHLQGSVAEKFLNSAIIDVSGVGYEVSLTAQDFDNFNLGDTVKIYTYHAVRENSEDLFGFSSLAAKRLFELLLTAQGIGPKAAMSILSLAPAEEVRNALATADVAFIAKAAGVGKKSAERAVVHLKDKVGVPSRYGRAPDQPEILAKTPADEALEALMALGFTLNDATNALAEVDPALPTADRVRAALKSR